MIVRREISLKNLALNFGVFYNFRGTVSWSVIFGSYVSFRGLETGHMKNPNMESITLKKVGAFLNSKKLHAG